MTTVLVVGASGDVGGATACALRDAGARVRVLVRSTPVAMHGVEHVSGDLGDRASLDQALDGVEAAVFVTPHHVDERRLGMTFLDACEAATLRRLVYVSAFHPLSRSRVIQRLLDGAIGLIGPHYRAKLEVERRVRRLPRSPVVLCPSNFFQNDELVLGAILGGVYAQPLGARPANRVDVRDIADAAVRALVTDEVAPGAYPLAGPDAWTGDACARVWSVALGRPVVYGGDDLTAWRQATATRLSAAKAADFDRTLRIIQRWGIPASAAVRARAEALLGRPARRYESYVAQRVAETVVHRTHESGPPHHTAGHQGSRDVLADP